MFDGELCELVGTVKPNLTPIQSTNPPLHNDSIPQTKKNPIPTSLTDENGDLFYSTLPLFLKNENSIKIPAKTQRVLERYIPCEMLKEIHPNREVAIELCLFWLTNLTNTYFLSLETNDLYRKAGWKDLKASYLDEQFSGSWKTRKAIQAVLEHKTTKGAIIECDHLYLQGLHSFGYRLGSSYFGKGIINYELKTEYVKKMVRKHYLGLLSKSSKNIICRNLFVVYGNITLPTKEEITLEAKKLIKDKHISNKGMELTFLNKHAKNYYKDADKRSFVEDCIEIFEYLTDNGLMIPQPGDEKSGGRVVDSFTLMPGWIRDMIKINGKRITKADYSALHPNIAATIYGGTYKFITHEQVAEESGIDKKTVKVEHLSFFNKTWEQMGYSPLFDYYNSKQPKMMEQIYLDKTYNDYQKTEKHKITSVKLFSKETDLITEAVELLNKEGIYVGYIYDALFSEPNDNKRVMEIMNLVALRQGVYTTAK